MDSWPQRLRCTTDDRTRARVGTEYNIYVIHRTGRTRHLADIGCDGVNGGDNNIGYAAIGRYICNTRRTSRIRVRAGIGRNIWSTRHTRRNRIRAGTGCNLGSNRHHDVLVFVYQVVELPNQICMSVPLDK